MRTATNAARFGLMTETRGGQLQDRRLRHGFNVSQLHRASGVSREAIDAAEADKASDVTYARLEAWFDAFEEETGYSEPARERPGDPHMVTIRGSRGGDIDVVVSGPIENIEQLAATVERLLRNTEERKGQAEDDPK